MATALLHKHNDMPCGGDRPATKRHRLPPVAQPRHWYGKDGKKTWPSAASATLSSPRSCLLYLQTPSPSRCISVALTLLKGSWLSNVGTPSGLVSVSLCALHGLRLYTDQNRCNIEPKLPQTQSDAPRCPSDSSWTWCEPAATHFEKARMNLTRMVPKQYWYWYMVGK